MSCVTWHLPPPPLGPGPDQQGVCVAVCVHLKRLRGGGKVVMYVYMLGCSVSPLPHFPTVSLCRCDGGNTARQVDKSDAAAGQHPTSEGLGGENEGKRSILFI